MTKKEFNNTLAEVSKKHFGDNDCPEDIYNQLWDIFRNKDPEAMLEYMDEYVNSGFHDACVDIQEKLMALVETVQAHKNGTSILLNVAKQTLNIEIESLPDLPKEKTDRSEIDLRKIKKAKDALWN